MTMTHSYLRATSRSIGAFIQLRQKDTGVLTSWSYLNDTTVKIIVGRHAQVFEIHKRLLTAASPVFKAMLSSGMIEQQKNEILLPEDSARGFVDLVRCMYSLQVAGDPLDSDDDDTMSKTQAWQLAQKYDMPNLQNMLMDWLRIYFACHYMHPQFLSWALRNTQSTSELQKFIFDQLTYELAMKSDRYRPAAEYEFGTTNEPGALETSDRYESASAELEILLATSEVSLKLFWAVNDLKPGGDEPAALEGCHYHLHAEGDSCLDKTSSSIDS